MTIYRGAAVIINLGAARMINNEAYDSIFRRILLSDWILAVAVGPYSRRKLLIVRASRSHSPVVEPSLSKSSNYWKSSDT